MFHTKSNFSIAPRVLGGLMDDFFQNGWGRAADERLDVFNVPVNVLENEKEYQLQVVAPGLQKENFRLSVDKNMLTISYSKKEEGQKQEISENDNNEPSGKTLRMEYRFHSFKRSFTLNDKINTTGITAKYTDGILYIGLPKKETAEPTTQEIVIN